ncbi:hypothetical protein [uncultured Sphingomonas sp.]|uniref:hypothetical protein n=1 Tax=uncultured Sphingomonas sp. TaxID=158754 RepID=UPI0035CA0A6C
MATRSVDIRNDRLVVLLSKGEKMVLMARAKSAAMSVSDYVRTATERFEFEEEMPEDIGAEIMRQIDEVKARMQATFDDLDAYIAARPKRDPETIRAEVFAELEQADIDWDEVRVRLGLNA